MAGPTGLSPGDVLRDLFSMPGRQWNELQSAHWCLSLWDKLRDEHLRNVVLTYAAYAAIPLIAAEVAPWLMLPLALTGVGEAVAGLAVLGTAAGLAGAGTAWLNVENGEKWYQGLGLQLVATVGELWAQAGGGLPSEVQDTPGYKLYGELDELGRPTGAIARVTDDMLGTGTKPTVTPKGFGGGAMGHARGHLLGKQFGGSGGDLRNIAVLYRRANRHTETFENALRAAVEAGETVYYRVTPVYQGTNLIPVGVTLRARGTGGFTLDVSILNR